MHSKVIKSIHSKWNKPKRDKFSGSLSLFQDTDPLKTLQTGKVMALAWAKKLTIENHLASIQEFIKLAVGAYWNSIYNTIRELPECAPLDSIRTDDSVKAVAEAVGQAAAKLEVADASYYIGNLYTSLLPENIRSANGVFYTPPALAERLITMAAKAGDIKWDQISIADPACGCGAFLIPMTLRIVEASKTKTAEQILQHIETNLRGFEIDQFAGWLCQVFIEIALKKIILFAGRPVKNIIIICDTLNYPFKDDDKFDLVIGNPPYGKVKLTDIIALRYTESLYGHPNLYGLFTHLAIDITKQEGTIAYLTPTSFLSGEYFKKLRAYIGKNAQPVEVDFVSVRKDVFEDVLQETMLATYVKNSYKNNNERFLAVNELTALSPFKTETKHIGKFGLSNEIQAPWILSKHHNEADIVQSMDNMKSRLQDWGYKVVTGQLVWNRFKQHLTDDHNALCYPIIWSESVLPDGTFFFKADKKNHKKWFLYSQNLNFLLTKTACVLLQRTTAKEQSKRLIATVLPQSFIDNNKAVIVENHLNIITTNTPNPAVSLEVLSTFLNSKVVNDAFRTISGSVAVSAYELEALPLPDAISLKKLIQLIKNNASNECIEEECRNLYFKN